MEPFNCFLQYPIVPLDPDNVNPGKQTKTFVTKSAAAMTLSTCVTRSMQLSVVSQCDVDAYHRCSVCSYWLTLCCVLYFECNGSSLTGVIILWHMFVVVTRPTTDVMEQMVS